MKTSLYALMFLFSLVLVLPSDVSAFGGNVNQGSKSKVIPKLSKKDARLLGKIGHGALVRQIKKAKKVKAAKALIAKAMKLIKEHTKKAKAQAKAKSKAKPKKRKGIFGR